MASMEKEVMHEVSRIGASLMRSVPGVISRVTMMPLPFPGISWIFQSTFSEMTSLTARWEVFSLMCSMLFCAIWTLEGSKIEL